MNFLKLSKKFIFTLQEKNHENLTYGLQNGLLKVNSMTKDLLKGKIASSKSYYYYNVKGYATLLECDGGRITALHGNAY